MISIPGGEVSVDWGFPYKWLPRHIHAKEMFALLEVLTECCRAHPGQFRRGQLVMGIDNRSVLDAFNKGRSRNPITHELLVGVFELQVDQAFWLSLRWVPTADSRSADAITRSGLAEIIRLQPVAFQRLQSFFGEFPFDLMASPENAQAGPTTRTGEKQTLPLFSRYHCEESAGVDVFRQNVAVTQGRNPRAVGYCFPPPVMVGHMIQHMAEYKAHAVIVFQTCARTGSHRSVVRPNERAHCHRQAVSATPITRTECAITCTRGTECVQSRATSETGDVS